MKYKVPKKDRLLLSIAIGLLFLLFVVGKAKAADVPISASDLNVGVVPVYNSLDNLVVQGELDVNGWRTLKGLTVSFELELKDQVSPILEGAMSGNSAITSVSAPFVTTIEGTSSGAFDSCTSLKYINFPAVTSIGMYTFFDTAVENVCLPSITSVESAAFMNCASLKSVSMPVATDIIDFAFYNCASLEDVNLPSAISVGLYAFSVCTSVQNISLPATTSLAASAFSGCSALKSVNLPAVTSIASRAFATSSVLQDYIFGATPPTVVSANSTAGTPTSPDYYTTGNITASPWLGFTLSSANHPSPTLHNISANTYALTPLTDTTVVLGSSYSFPVTLSGSVPPTISQNWVLWELLGSSNVRSTVDAYGNVTIDPYELNTTLTLRAFVNIGGIIESQTAILTILTTLPTPTATPVPTPRPSFPAVTVTPAPIIQVPTQGNQYTTIYPGSLDEYTTFTVTKEQGLMPLGIFVNQTMTTPEGTIIEVQNETLDERTQENVVVPTTTSYSSLYPLIGMIMLICFSVLMTRMRRYK